MKRVAVVTEFQASLRDGGLRKDFCAAVKRIAERGAPVPVECVEPGSPALQTDGTVVLIAQAAVQDVEGRPVLVLTTRKDREGGLDPRPIFFGSAPRAVPLTGSAADRAAMEQALGASLGETLSWLRPIQSDDPLPVSSKIKRERVNG